MEKEGSSIQPAREETPLLQTTSSNSSEIHIRVHDTMEDSFTRSVQDVAKSFDVHPENGLTDSQVLALRAKHGRNGKLTPTTALPCLFYNKP